MKALSRYLRGCHVALIELNYAAELPAWQKWNGLFPQNRMCCHGRKGFLGLSTQGSLGVVEEL